MDVDVILRKALQSGVQEEDQFGRLSLQELRSQSARQGAVRGEADELETRSYAVVFPKVLTDGLDRGQAPRQVTISDARLLIRWYFAEMADGVRFEAAIRAPENRYSPNTLTEMNWRNAQLIHARGLSMKYAAHLFGHPLVGLAMIHPDADLFTDWDAVRLEVFSLLREFMAVRGIGAANATKLLAQKRPALFPIIDSYERQAFNVPAQRDWVRVAELAFEQFIAVAGIPENETALTNLPEWLGTHPQVTGGLALSRVRCLDIISWVMVRQRLWNEATLLEADAGERDAAGGENAAPR